MSAKKRATKKKAKKAAKPASARKKATKPKRIARTKPKPKAKASAKAKARAKSKPRPKAKSPGIQRRDHAGHMDPKYASGLRALGGDSDVPERTNAFLTNSRSKDDLAEELGEEFVEEATSGEHEGEEIAGQSVPEELGGPFVVTSADTEFAEGTDASNPKGAKREPFPRT